MALRSVSKAEVEFVCQHRIAGFFDYYFSLRNRKVPALNSGPALLTEIIRDVSPSLLANTWIEIQITLLWLP